MEGLAYQKRPVAASFNLLQRPGEECELRNQSTHYTIWSFFFFLQFFSFFFLLWIVSVTI